MAYDKEKTKLSYYELSPTLQKLIDSKIVKPKMDTLAAKAAAIDARLNGITVTAGLTRPISVNANKNLNLNTQINILEIYKADGWHRQAPVFK